jgi:hypothetical protein
LAVRLLVSVGNRYWHTQQGLRYTSRNYTDKLDKRILLYIARLGPTPRRVGRQYLLYCSGSGIGYAMEIKIALPYILSPSFAILTVSSATLSFLENLPCNSCILGHLNVLKQLDISSWPVSTDH